MARFERLEPRSDDSPLFDGGMDDGDDAEEGSRLPLLIVIALLVLAAFAGVVWLAYTQGVERGRADAPRIIVAQGSSPQTSLKVYQQQAPADEDSSDSDSVPAPPTLATRDAPPPASPPAAAPSPVAPAPSVASTQTAPTPNPPKASTPPAASKPAALASRQTPAPASAAQPPPRVATHAPASLVASAPPPAAPVETPPANPAPAAAEAPATPAPAKASTTGGYLLQIGAYKSQDEADAAWHAFQAKHSLANDYQSNVKQVDLGAKGTWYRLRIGSFADKDAAQTFCAKLKADGADCLVAK